MKSVTALLIVFLGCVSMTFAGQSKMTLEMALQMRAQASGAIDTVLQLLEDLRKSSLNEQADLEARNKTQEEEGIKLISELTQILNTNQKNYDDSVSHRQFIEKEIEDTEAHLEWIAKRLVEIERKLEELKVQRCQANAMFVQSLKEHNDAIKAVQILTDEINRLHAAGELAQIKTLTNKFQAYEHLFQAEAVKSFLDLANSNIDDVTGFQDNDKAALKLDKMATDPSQRNLKGSLVEKVLQMLAGLVSHLKASQKNLEVNEIQAAYDYADFKASSEIENVTLREDQVRKEKYAAKLEIDVEVARENEDRTLVLRDEAQINLDSAVADLDVKRKVYAESLARVLEDINTIDQVITIFRQRVATMQDALKQRVDEYQTGDDMTRFTRSAETDSGKLHGNLNKVAQGQQI